MLAELDPNSSELKFTDIVEPGYHYPKTWVDRCYLWLERWGILPDELERQDRRIVEDIELRSAMKSQVQREYLKEKEERNSDDGSF